MKRIINIKITKANYFVKYEILSRFFKDLAFFLLNIIIENTAKFKIKKSQFMKFV